MKLATYRQVHTAFWQDSFVLDLTPEEKFFYLYLMTNSKTRQCGVYELPRKIIEIETGYNRETVDKLLQRFIQYKKILYDSDTKEIYIINWLKYNWINSVKVIKCIEKEIALIKSQHFRGEIYRIYTLLQNGDTVSIDLGEEKEKEEEQEVEKEITAKPAESLPTIENELEVDESDSAKSDGHQPGFSLPTSDNMSTATTLEPTAEKIILKPDEAEFFAVLEAVKDYPLNRQKDLEYYHILAERYPNLDLLSALKDWQIHKIGKPLKPKDNARSQINTWFQNAVKWGKNKKSSPRPALSGGTNDKFKGFIL